MAADVSCLVRILSRYNDNRTVIKDSLESRSTVALMTRDLLGSGGCGGEGDDPSLELDLDLQVPTGWEKRLDLKSGKVYLQQQCDSKNSLSSTHHHHHHHIDHSNQTVPRFQDLNFPPGKPLLRLFDDTIHDELKLVPSSLSRPHPPSSSSNTSFQSVCTLDKVKSALERVDKKRRSPEDDVCDRTASDATPVAAGCPGCLTYVLVSKKNPKCPRCLSLVPLPSMKKPKIDLNISI